RTQYIESVKPNDGVLLSLAGTSEFYILHIPILGSLPTASWDTLYYAAITDTTSLLGGFFVEFGSVFGVAPGGELVRIEPLSGEVLVGCTVAPGFEFADFTLMGARSPEARKLVSVDPRMSKLIGG
ncbi:MAG: cupin domain-containing protein, partial [Fibrobacterota bacterium]